MNHSRTGGLVRHRHAPLRCLGEDALRDKTDAGGSTRGLLAGVLEQYSGPFLEGEDEDWILVERERLHSLYVRAANELAQEYAGMTRYEEAVEVLRGVLAYDPFRETVHRQLMVMLVLNGQRAEALRSHERWRDMMRRDLGICPMPRTVELMALVRSDRIFERLDEFREAYRSDR